MNSVFVAAPASGLVLRARIPRPLVRIEAPPFPPDPNRFPLP